jgi:hypothetical protein
VPSRQVTTRTSTGVFSCIEKCCETSRAVRPSRNSWTSASSNPPSGLQGRVNTRTFIDQPHCRAFRGAPGARGCPPCIPQELANERASCRTGGRLRTAPARPDALETVEGPMVQEPMVRPAAYGSDLARRKPRKSLR